MIRSQISYFFHNIGHYLRWVGVVASAILLVFFVLWGYRLAQREVGGVPVVAAPEGPMREAVEQVDGASLGIETRLDLSINTLMETEDKIALPDSVTLAPLPMAFEPEDIPVGAIAQAEPPAPEGNAPPPTFFAAPASAPQPTPRPADLQEPLPVLESVPERIALDLVVAGASLVQLGSFPQEATAVTEWRRLRARFSGLLRDKSLVVQPAVVSGQTTHRLRVYGFRDDNDTRRFCAAIKAEGADCIPVRHR